jgi:hypothetical protein
MKAAIDAALGYKAEGAGEGSRNEQDRRGEAGREEAGSRSWRGQGDRHPPRERQAEEEREGRGPRRRGQGRPKQAPKVKTAAELDLKPEQKKLLKPETQAASAS